MAVETEQVHQSNGYGFGPLKSIPMLNQIHAEAMDDHDGDMASKMGCSRSGGRRKQSKPIRVFMDVDPMENDNPDQTVVSQQAPVLSSEPTAAEKPQPEMQVDEAITCDLCNETFVTQSALTQHIHRVHQIADDENEDNFPTKYHQLGSEFQQETNLRPIDKEENGNATSETMLPKPDFINGRNSNSPSSGERKSSNIFHQDAFCELCDREFCNKYFLKTHKANKHGVFDNSPCESPNGFMPALIPLRMEEEAPSEAPLLSLPKDLSTLSSPAPKTSLTSSPPVLPQPPQHAQGSKSHNSSPKASSPSSIVSTIASLTTSASSAKRASDKPVLDMEDYCELCQKHFCNKYYLKKHKQDVHGIVPEDTPGAKRARPDHCSPLSRASPNPLLLPQSASPLTSSAVNINGAIPGLSSMANVMFINPFGPPLALLQPQQLMQNANSGGFHPQLSGLPPVPQPIPGAESPKTSIPSSISPTGGFPLPSDTLRTMGMPNTEAQCELCKKTFCNKYFMRIHKASKHGMPMDNIPSSLPLLLPGMPGMPENLGLPGSGKELGEVLSKKESTPPTSPDSKRERFMLSERCDICKKDFPNQYSLKIHLINAHNQRIPDFDFIPELSKAESQTPSIPGNTMFNNMIAAKLADRVICDLCNKEVCNKYFLKTHKIKVHGMDPQQAERECSPNPMMMNPNPLIPTSLSLPTPPKEVPIPPPADPVPRPSDSELLKMGIDPEAYCEICKKEFCSKYFLKTHKWNLHGIKTADGTPPSGARLGPKVTPKLERTPTVGSVSSGQRRNWKWKEPANSMRVMCELCNKELCNKYFLKTHMLNKHGINIDVSAGAPGFPSALPQPQLPSGFPLPPFPFPGFMKDENSNTNKPTNSSSENGMHEPKKGFPAEMEKIVNMVKREMKESSSMDTHSMDVPPEPQASPNVMSAQTWAIPEDKIKTENDEAINLATHSIDKPIDFSYPEQTAPPKVISKTEQDETIKTSDGEFAILKCNLCGMIFGDQDTLSLHVMRDHPSQEPSHDESAISMEETPIHKSSSVTSLGLSLKRKYQFGVRRKAQHMQKLKRLGGGTSIAEKVKSAIVNHIQNHLKKKKFKCAFCHEKFSLRSLCQQHIRTKHKRETSLTAEELAEDSSCDVRTPGGAKPPSGVTVPSSTGDTIMQPFTVEENADGGNFASSIVYLPVYNKISKPLSVTFTLTPADH